MKSPPVTPVTPVTATKTLVLSTWFGVVGCDGCYLRDPSHPSQRDGCDGWHLEHPSQDAAKKITANQRDGSAVTGVTGVTGAKSSLSSALGRMP